MERIWLKMLSLFAPWTNCFRNQAIGRGDAGCSLFSLCRGNLAAGDGMPPARD